MILSNKDYHSYSSIFRAFTYSMLIHSEVHSRVKRWKLRELSFYREVELLSGNREIKNIHVESNKINVEL